MATADSGAEPSSRKLAARAGFNLGVVLGKLGRGEDEIAAYSDLVRRFGEDQDPGVREQVATGLINQGVTFLQLERGEDAIAAYSD